MEKNNTIEGLPAGKRSQFYRAFERVLRDDAVLKGVGVNWLTYDEDSATASAAPVTASMCPAIRLAMSAPYQDADIDDYTSLTTIHIEAYTAGLVIDDIADLWEAIEAAVSNTKPYDGTTVETSLRVDAAADESGRANPSWGTFRGRFGGSMDLSTIGETETQPTMFRAKGTYVGAQMIRR